MVTLYMLLLFLRGQCCIQPLEIVRIKISIQTRPRGYDKMGLRAYDNLVQ